MTLDGGPSPEDMGINKDDIKFSGLERMDQDQKPPETKPPEKDKNTEKKVSPTDASKSFLGKIKQTIREEGIAIAAVSGNLSMAGLRLANGDYVGAAVYGSVAGTLGAGEVVRRLAERSDDRRREEIAKIRKEAHEAGVKL